MLQAKTLENWVLDHTNRIHDMYEKDYGGAKHYYVKIGDKEYVFLSYAYDVPLFEKVRNPYWYFYPMLNPVAEVIKLSDNELAAFIVTKKGLPNDFNMKGGVQSYNDVENLFQCWVNQLKMELRVVNELNAVLGGVVNPIIDKLSTIVKG